MLEPYTSVCGPYWDKVTSMNAYQIHLYRHHHQDATMGPVATTETAIRALAHYRDFWKNEHVADVDNWKSLQVWRKEAAKMQEKLDRLDELREIVRRKLDEDDAMNSLEKDKLF